MPINKAESASTALAHQLKPEDMKRPTLNAWQSVAETRLPREVLAQVHAHDLFSANVMLAGPNEFVVGGKAGEKALHVFRDDPDNPLEPFKVHVGTLDASLSFEVARAEGGPTAESQPNAQVTGDASLRNAGTRQEIGGGIAVRLGADKGLLFSDLPKAVQDEVKAHIEQHNELESASMSPQKIEFLRAKGTDNGFDVTFMVRDWTGQSSGESTARFGAALPTPPPSPTVSGGALTSLEAVPAAARGAIEARIATLNEQESMSMSPQTYSFVSATPLSDGGFDVKLHAAGFFGGGDDYSQKLGADGSWG